MILALDPSSTRVGYALMRGPDDLAEAGLLLPGKTRDAAIFRIPAIAKDLSALIADAKPHEVVIEVTSGHVNHGRNRGSGAGLGVYGMAVGYCWAVAEVLMPGCVATVEENTWTASTPKATRTERVARRFRAYNAKLDPGGDVADAIGLGRWYLLRMGVARAG